MPFDLAVWSYHVQKLTKKPTFDDVSITVFLYRFSLANVLIMKLGQLVESFKWSVLVYSLLS